MNDKGHYIDAWDLLIAHPPCTYLSNAGARHLWKGHVLQADRVMKGIEGRDLFMRFWWADVPQICIENPIPSRVFCLPQYTQTIQPYEYGHPYSKKTCLWLKNLPPLFPTDIVTPIATWCPSGSYSKSMDNNTKVCLRLTGPRTEQKHLRVLQMQCPNNGDRKTENER